MSDNIKELVNRLRERPFRHASESDLEAIERRQSERVKAADALEAMAGEVERLKDRDAINATCHFQAAEINKLETERDRLAGEVATLRERTAISLGVGGGHGSLFVYGDHESIKAAQGFIIRENELLAERDRLKAALQQIASQKTFAELEAEVAALRVTQERQNSDTMLLRQCYVTLAFAFYRLHESARSRDGELCLDFQRVRALIEKRFREIGIKL